MLREIFGAKKDEVTGEWRRLHKKELRDLYCSPNTIWVIISRKMRWAEHGGEERCTLGADKSLARPTSRCIFLMVRILRLILVLLYIYI